MVISSLILAGMGLLALMGAAYHIKHRTPQPPCHQPIVAYKDETDTQVATTVTIEPMSAALSGALKSALTEMKDCQAIAYVDTRALRLVGMETITHLPQAVIELIAAATSDLFTAPNLVKVSNIFKEYKGKPLESSNFNEMIVRGEGTVYIFLRAHSDVHHVCVFSCTDDDAQLSSFGLLLHQARLQMQKIEVAAHAAFLVE